MPMVYAVGSLYAKFRIVNIGLIALMLLLTGNYGRLLQHAFMNKYLLTILIMFLILFVLQSLGYRVEFTSCIVMLNSSIAMWIGYEAKLGFKNLKNLLIFHAIIAIILGYGAITTYLGNFSLESDLYLLDGKNQIGVHVAVATFVMFFFALITNIKKEKILALTLFGILLSLLVVIRCRTALVAMLVAAFILIHKVFNNKRLLLIYVACSLILIVFSNYFLGIISNVFLMDRDVTDVNELTTGRAERNVQAIEYIQEHFFDGELLSPAGIELIHNYILKNLVTFGIWCLPLLVCYFMIIYRIFKQTICVNKIYLSDIGYFVMLIPLFNSLLEPSAPFGPGSVMVFMFLLLGISFRNSPNSVNY